MNKLITFIVAVMVSFSAHVTAAPTTLTHNDLASFAVSPAVPTGEFFSNVSGDFSGSISDTKFTTSASSASGFGSKFGAGVNELEATLIYDVAGSLTLSAMPWIGFAGGTFSLSDLLVTIFAEDIGGARVESSAVSLAAGTTNGRTAITTGEWTGLSTITSYGLTFSSAKNGDLSISNFHVSVPEPGTILLMLMGLLAVSLFMRKSTSGRGDNVTVA